MADLPSFTATSAAAAASVGTDLLSGEVFSRETQNRVLTGVAYTGSAVIGDTAVEVYVGKTLVGNFYNSALLTPQVQRDLVPLEALGVPGGTQLRVVVTDAPATSPVFIQLTLMDV